MPLRGSLYAQLLCSDDKRLKLRCSQKARSVEGAGCIRSDARLRHQLWLASNTAVKLFAMFTDNEVPRVRSQVKQYVC